MMNTNQWYEVNSRYHGLVARGKLETPPSGSAFFKSREEGGEVGLLSIVMGLGGLEHREEDHREEGHREFECGMGKAEGAIGLAPSIAPSDSVVSQVIALCRRLSWCDRSHDNIVIP
jgi:hypothetical protein